MLPEESQFRQPADGTLVWQDNRLSEARYDLSAREQKLVLYAVAMIEPEDEAFKRYRVNVQHFARLLGLDANALYGELRQIAESIARKPLLIANHLAPGYSKPRELLTHWFAEAEFGEGFIDVTFPPSLKPYLLRVKHDFFRYHLGVVLELKSAYAIRLYQWAKRWQFRKICRVDVSELRAILGTVDLDSKGEIITQRLPKYGDFKKWALQPAIKEINQRTDIHLGFVEEKRKGTKFVEALRFRITASAHAKDLETAPVPPGSQLEFSLDESETIALLEQVKTRFGLTQRQVMAVRAFVAEQGADYVREKIEVVCSQPRDNAARAFLGALKGDWKAPIKITTAKEKSKSGSLLREPEGWRDYLTKAYPTASLPLGFSELPQSIRDECLRELKVNKARKQA